MHKELVPTIHSVLYDAMRKFQPVLSNRRVANFTGIFINKLIPENSHMTKTDTESKFKMAATVILNSVCTLQAFYSLHLNQATFAQNLVGTKHSDSVTVSLTFRFHLR